MIYLKTFNKLRDKIMKPVECDVSDSWAMYTSPADGATAEGDEVKLLSSLTTNRQLGDRRCLAMMLSAGWMMAGFHVVQQDMRTYCSCHPMYLYMYISAGSFLQQVCHPDAGKQVDDTGGGLRITRSASSLLLQNEK